MELSPRAKSLVGTIAAELKSAEAHDALDELSRTKQGSGMGWAFGLGVGTGLALLARYLLRAPKLPWLSDQPDPSDARTKEQKVAEALGWISQLFDRIGVDYVVSGGLGARIHGASRPLWDIDIDVTDEGLDRVAADPEVQQLLLQLGETGPAR